VLGACDEVTVLAYSKSVDSVAIHSESAMGNEPPLFESEKVYAPGMI
jgi:hypothetical protein